MSRLYSLSIFSAGLFLVMAGNGMFPNIGNLVVNSMLTPSLEMVGGTLCNATDHQLTSCEPLTGQSCTYTWWQGYAKQGNLRDEEMQQQWACTQSGCLNIQNAWVSYYQFQCTDNGAAPGNINWPPVGNPPPPGP